MRIWTMIFGLFAVAATATASAQDLTWRKDIQPIMTAKCAGCHGANQPGFDEWNVKRVNDKSLAPRLDTYAFFMNHVVWPETGAIMRRLDDGKGAAGGKPGNMYSFLGADDAERAKNLQTLKAWLGEGAWNLNRWQKRGDTPGISKEQLDKIKAKY
ncbi:MAG: cytochrome C [Burkholderiales bacterium]|nr:cytochrome C [Burkholderiales bacterium]